MGASKRTVMLLRFRTNVVCALSRLRARRDALKAPRVNMGAQKLPPQRPGR